MRCAKELVQQAVGEGAFLQLALEKPEGLPYLAPRRRAAPSPEQAVAVHGLGQAPAHHWCALCTGCGTRSLEAAPHAWRLLAMATAPSACKD